MTGGQLINQSELQRLIQRKTMTKQATALHSLLRQFPLGDTFSGRTIHRIIRLEMLRYRTHTHHN